MKVDEGEGFLNELFKLSGEVRIKGVAQANKHLEVWSTTEHEKHSITDTIHSLSSHACRLQKVLNQTHVFKSRIHNRVTAKQ